MHEIGDREVCENGGDYFLTAVDDGDSTSSDFPKGNGKAVSVGTKGSARDSAVSKYELFTNTWISDLAAHLKLIRYLKHYNLWFSEIQA